LQRVKQKLKGTEFK